MKKGFTLIELLIVIGVLAALAMIAVLVLNPTELLKQSRDSQRMADLANLKKAIAVHLATGTAPDTNYGYSGTRCQCTVATSTSPFTCTGNGCGSGTAVSSTITTGIGWVNVNLGDVTGNVSPLSALPLDPLPNSAIYFYAYAGNDATMTYKIVAKLESAKYSSKMAADGGSNSGFYEAGSNLSL
ncbi:MAG: type II secretion system protein [Candidatus Wolfebacteria bacterium]|nr:type II secretion system protein [Candidatus Wolfebacteria bacterium]